MIGLILVTIILTAVLIGCFYLLYQLLINFQPGSNKINQDLRKMREEIQPWIDDLIPWTAEEMELLSFNQVNKVLKKGVAPTVKGIITSIYNEPMIAYSYKRYVSPNPNALLLVRTSHHEFVYRIRNKVIEVHIDKQPVGTIREGGLFYHRKNNRLLARINREEGELLLPVIVGDREVGSLNLPDKTMKANARAFQLLSKMSKEEEAIFLSLTSFELIKGEIDGKN